MWEMVRDEAKNYMGPSPEVLPITGLGFHPVGKGSLGKRFKALEGTRYHM